MIRTASEPLIQLLARTLVQGCAAGVAGGLVVAHFQPAIGAVLSASAGSMGRFAFLFVCAQVGAVVALAFAMVPARQ